MNIREPKLYIISYILYISEMIHLDVLYIKYCIIPFSCTDCDCYFVAFGLRTKINSSTYDTQTRNCFTSGLLNVTEH